MILQSFFADLALQIFGSGPHSITNPDRECFAAVHQLIGERAADLQDVCNLVRF